uniref:Uncharacterized protein n=1 Tax=Oryza meridionalis TaxID=40149 RepID=A0A0E0EM36_9ORYZ
MAPWSNTSGPKAQTHRQVPRLLRTWTRGSPRVALEILEASRTRHVNPLLPPRLLLFGSSKFQSSAIPLSCSRIDSNQKNPRWQRTGIRNTARNSGARAARSTSMEKKELLGVRKSPPLTKRRRKVTAGGAGGGSMAKAIAAYLASDSFMYAPLVSNSPTPPPPSSPPAGAGSSDKMVALVQKYRGSWRGALAFNIEESEHQRRQRLAAWQARCATSDCHLYSCCDQEMLMINRVQANAEHMLLQPEPCLRWIVQIVEPHKQQAQLLTHGWAPEGRDCAMLIRILDSDDEILDREFLVSPVSLGESLI